MKRQANLKAPILLFLAAMMAAPPGVHAANHREAPITALDHKADITDFFAFVSFNDPDKVTFSLNVDPLLQPSNGPTYFPFDPDLLYAIKVDNNHDAVEDITFEFRFRTIQRLPGVFTVYVGAGEGIGGVIPPAITRLDGEGSEGLGQQQTYTITMVKGDTRTDLTGGRKLVAVPSNVGSRTMPNYPSLHEQGIYELDNGVRIWAGTADDPFWIDLGAAFDSLNFRKESSDPTRPFLLPGVMSPAQDEAFTNFASDSVSGFNVNVIALEVPIAMLIRDGKKHEAANPRATIGTWGTTSRRRVTLRRSPLSALNFDGWRQIQRMGNPLINELLIGVGSKDRFSMDKPKNDAQFADPFFLDPLLAKVLNAIYGIELPPTPRVDLLPLVTYQPPIAAPGTPAGPVADLLRLNTGVPPTPFAEQKRFPRDTYTDAAGNTFIVGFPNGRRPDDDVTDIAARAVAGVLAGGKFAEPPYTLIGDGVNINDVPLSSTFPYLGYAHSGRDSRHADPGEPLTLEPGAPILPIE